MGQAGVEGLFLVLEFAAAVDAVADGGGLHLSSAEGASDPSAEGVGACALFSGSFLPAVVADALSAEGLDGVEPVGADDRFVGGFVGVDPLLGGVVGHAGGVAEGDVVDVE
ncbi:hypothetical protein ACFY3M_46110 [Streptomyces mirabilis]|uniref:hypothetical protein n=1 Tax=Streptomyces mirabilis TaxID=68239 RepID=UPI0036960C67